MMRRQFQIGTTDGHGGEGRGSSQQITEPISGQASSARYRTHGVRIQRIVAGNRNNASAIGHHYVLTLASDPEARFLQNPYGVQMIDARQFRRQAGTWTSRISSCSASSPATSK